VPAVQGRGGAKLAGDDSLLEFSDAVADLSAFLELVWFSSLSFPSSKV
jgi:hypothetical protein